MSDYVFSHAESGVMKRGDGMDTQARPYTPHPF